MTPETPTPRTDAQPWINRYPEYHEGATRWVTADFARQLERELAEVTQSLAFQTQLNREAIEREKQTFAELAAAKTREKRAVDQRDAAKNTRAELLRHLDVARENERKAQLQLVLAQQMHEAERALADRLAETFADVMEEFKDWDGILWTDEDYAVLAAWKEARK